MLDQGISDANLSALFGGPALTTCQSPDQVPIEGDGDRSPQPVSLQRLDERRLAKRRAADARRGGEPDRPPTVAIDLHFMMSAYGQSDYHPEILLGIGMQVLHETPFSTATTSRKRSAARPRT